jgi:hypothetical protein
MATVNYDEMKLNETRQPPTSWCSYFDVNEIMGRIRSAPLRKNSKKPRIAGIFSG